nr:hypothetical protein [Pseudonocardia humida]
MVAGDDRAADRKRDGAGFSPDVEGLAVAVEDDGDDLGVAAQCPECGGGGGATEVEAGGAGAVLQVGQGHRDRHAGAFPGGGGEDGVAVGGGEPADLGEGVGVAFGGAARVLGGARGGFGVDDGGDHGVADGVGEHSADLPAAPGQWGQA